MASSRLSKKWVLIMGIIVGGILFGTVAGFLFALTHDLPQVRALEDYQPSAVTRVFSADHVLLAELFAEKRDPVPLDAVPRHLVAAVIATEDRSFYAHSGADLKGILRAAIKDIRKGEFAEGASTITQQLAKNLFLTPKKTLIRKAKEAFLAFQLERRYTKDEILAMYLNTIYFGSGAYGVESASRMFFGKAVKDLSLAECALIAGMPKRPSRYSPLVDREQALLRRNTVLQQMADTGVITNAACEEALSEPITVAEGRGQRIKAPYFVEYIRAFLEEEARLGSTLLYRGGVTVHTTLSFTMQEAAERGVAGGVRALETRMKQRGMGDADAQCALIALDVRSGGILAMVGGKDFFSSPFNRAVQARRQSGSAFKPILYALAIEKGFAQNRMILDAPVVYKGASGQEDWEPENFSEDHMGELTLRQALALSVNIPAVRLIEEIGPAPVVRFAQTLGIGTPLSPYLSLALGASEVTLIDLTSAYAVFANMGKRVEPYAVREVTDQNGRVLWRAKTSQKVAMSQAGAAVITNMLEGVVQEGTGSKAKILRRSVAGKTGTTNEYKDALFVGFSPSVAAGVWVGRDRHLTIGRGETGARAALPVWIEFMRAALADGPSQEFDVPDDVVRISMDPTTGEPAPGGASGSVIALFKKGTEPVR